MNNTSSIFSHSKAHRFFTYFLSIIGQGILIFGLFESLKNGYTYFAFFFIIPAMLLIPIEVIHTARTKLYLSNNYIEVSSFSKKRLFFNDIKKILVQKSGMILYGADCKINITGEFERKEEIFMFIASKIEDLPDLEIKGFKSEVNKYFQ